MNVTIEKLRTFVEELQAAGPGDYQSHQEFANVLLDALGSKEAQRLPLKDLSMYVNVLSRKDNWYEMAVLQDLLIVDHSMNFHPKFLKSWVIQSAALQEQRPPYHVLIAMAYEWLAGEYRTFSPDNLPNVSERPRPPKPQWLAFIEAEPPANMGPPCTYFIEFLHILEEYRDNFSLICYQYYMACNEPDLLKQNLPLLRHRYKEETDGEWEKRWAHYGEVLCGQRAMRVRWQGLLNKRFNNAYAEAHKLAAACVKDRAVSAFLRQKEGL